MMSPLMIVSLDQGKLYAEKPASGVKDDLAFAAERMSPPAEHISHPLLRKLLSILRLTWRRGLKVQNREDTLLPARQV